MPDKVPTEGGEALGYNPFAALDASGLKSAAVTPSKAPLSPKPERNRGRVDIIREKGGRGGKTVTVVDGFTGIGLPEKEQLMRKVRAACGCGGTVKDAAIELQGDHRDRVEAWLRAQGWPTRRSGG